MTREQIEAWRLLLEHHEAGELCDLAERALQLEEVLREAKYVANSNDTRLVNGLVFLLAAIDRAKEKP